MLKWEDQLIKRQYVHDSTITKSLTCIATTNNAKTSMLKFLSV